MSDPDKIIYIVNANIPNGRAHGIQITETVEALSKQTKSISLVTPYFKGVAINEGYKSKSINVVLPTIDVLRYTKFGFRLKMFTFLISLYFYLTYEYIRSKLLKQNVVLYVRADMILGLVPFTSLFPTFFEAHYIRGQEKAYKWLCKYLAGVVVVTDALKTKIVSEFNISPKKVLVARDAVEISRFGTGEKPLLDYLPPGLNKDKKIVLYSGSLTEDKGVNVLADTSDFLDSSVQIVFLGGIGNQVEEFSKQYKDKSNISILGLVEHSEVAQYLQAADVLILPDLATSDFNNLYTSPMKLFEYMASGVTIIASEIPSLKEVLDTENSFFFKSGDSEDLARMIKYSLKNTEESKERARVAKKEVNQFTWSKRAEAILAFIKKHKT